MGGARMQGAAMYNAQTLGVQSAWMPGNQGSMGCDPLSMAMEMAQKAAQMALQMQSTLLQHRWPPPPQLAWQPQAQWAGSPLMPSARHPMMHPMGPSSWQQPAQQPRAQQEAQKTEGQESEAQTKPRRTERAIYASIKREQRKLERKQRKLEKGDRRKVKKTTTTKRPQQRAQPKREGRKPGEKSSAAQASSGEGGVLEVGALAVEQAKSEEQLTAYGGGAV